MPSKPKKRKEKMSIQHKVIEPRKNNESASLVHVYGQLEADNIEFTFMDGASYILTKDELFNAMQVICSGEFDSLCKSINRREDLYETVNNLYCDVVDNQNKDSIYDLYHNSKLLGKYGERAHRIRESIINRVSFNTWVTATRVYETLYQIPREWLG
jgi:hypothetical protein